MSKDIDKLYHRALKAVAKDRHKSTGLQAGTSAKDKLALLPSEMSVSFNIHVDAQDIIEENANERYGLAYGDANERSMMSKLGFIDDQGIITHTGWDQLVKDSRRLEDNTIVWLRKTFESVRDEGHDRYDDLIGEVWFNPRDKDQIEQVHMGLNERIDMSDSSYGSLAYDVWKGVSDFGQSLLGGAMNFEKYGNEKKEFRNEIEQILELHEDIRPTVKKKKR